MDTMSDSEFLTRAIDSLHERFEHAVRSSMSHYVHKEWRECLRNAHTRSILKTLKRMDPKDLLDHQIRKILKITGWFLAMTALRGAIQNKRLMARGPVSINIDGIAFYTSYPVRFEAESLTPARNLRAWFREELKKRDAARSRHTKDPR